MEIVIILFVQHCSTVYMYHWAAAGDYYTRLAIGNL